jgi:hypothetical protein
MAYPKRIRVKVEWSEAGLRRWHGQYPNMKPPKTRDIEVHSAVEERYARRKPPTAKEFANFQRRLAQWKKEDEEKTGNW